MAWDHPYFSAVLRAERWAVRASHSLAFFTRVVIYGANSICNVYGLSWLWVRSTMRDRTLVGPRSFSCDRWYKRCYWRSMGLWSRMRPQRCFGLTSSFSFTSTLDLGQGRGCTFPLSFLFVEVNIFLKAIYRCYLYIGSKHFIKMCRSAHPTYAGNVCIVILPSCVSCSSFRLFMRLSDPRTRSIAGTFLK